MATTIFPSTNDVGGGGNGKSLNEANLAAWISSIAQDFVVSGLTVSENSPDLHIVVSPGEAVISGLRVVLDGTYSISLLANATNHIYLQLTRDGIGNVDGMALTVNTNGATPDDSVKLATAITTASTVTSTKDARPRSPVSAVPSGVITMWSGSISSIPLGWALCDGNNGTPDLRGRFLVGAGGEYAVGATGGAASVVLSVTQLPPHSHTGTTNPAGSHMHKIPSRYNIANGGASQTLVLGDVSTLDTTAAGEHPHTFTTDNTGNGAAHENRPPYFALAFIMKL